MSDLLPAGYYKGRILDYGIKKTSKGDPAPTIAFEVKGKDGAVHKVYWQGSWQGGGMDITMEALLVCGLKNVSNLMRIAEGNSSRALDTALTLDLTIEIETNQNDPLKKFNRVKWINADGSSKFKDAISVQEFAPEVSSRGLVAELMRVAQEKGYEVSSSVIRNYPKSDDANIPF